MGPVRRVVVAGGGTAGYFAALALKRQLPDLDVTLVESSKIPIIGVGEATTTLMVPFLHQQLGIDIVELYRDVRPPGSSESGSSGACPAITASPISSATAASWRPTRTTAPSRTSRSSP